jgi:cyclophilin family peptidyl-prolyl cis-trans isomerase
MAIQIAGQNVINNSRLIQNIIGVEEPVVAITATLANTTVNLSSGSVFFITLNANTTLQFSNPPPNNVYRAFLIHLKQGTTARTVSIANGKYTEGVAPPYTNVANALDVISVYTIDGGATYNVSFVMADVK